MGEVAQEHVWDQWPRSGCYHGPLGRCDHWVPYGTVLLITVLQRLFYYDQTKAGSRLTLDDTSILPALGDAMRGALSVRHSENIVERVARVSSSQLRGMIQRFTYV